MASAASLARSGINRRGEGLQSHQECSGDENRLPSCLIDPDHGWDRRQKHATRRIETRQRLVPMDVHDTHDTSREERDGVTSQAQRFENARRVVQNGVNPS